jgi:hypothetical protein
MTGVLQAANEPLTVRSFADPRGRRQPLVEMNCEIVLDARGVRSI